jgi:type I restriction enzyme, S subunit
MGSEWKVHTLQEAGVTLIDCDHRTPPASTTGYPYVAIPQMQDGHLNLNDARKITYEHFIEWTKKARPKIYDVVLSRRCNPGETAFVASNADFALGQNLVLLRASGKIIYPPFLRWLTRGEEWWGQINKFRNVGAVFDSLKCADVPKFELTIPPINEQRAIAHILGTLDDKIELNRKMNETLEAMARAMFKAWFVDFEPVRAKMEGRWKRGDSLPGLPAHLYELFPDRLVDSELGEIPEGWTLSTIEKEVVVCGGATPSTMEPDFWENGHHCWATPKDLSSLRFPVLLETERKITDAGLTKISSGLLPIGTVLLSSRAPIGYLAIAEVPTAINQGFIAMKCNGFLPSEYVLLWCRENLDVIHSKANGSTFQEISKGNFRPIPIIIPSKSLLTSYKKSVGVIHRLIVMIEKQSRTLSKVRDQLLPKLISGELCVETFKSNM